MLVQPKDLVDELSGAGGEKFEAFVQKLVRAECRRHGITDAQVDWDYRTTCPDGGCDIFIKDGHTSANPRLIPNSPSLWSIKSGADGTESSTFARELRDSSHDRIRDHLNAGNIYVWCVLQPMSQGKREEMDDKRTELARELEFDPEQVVFFWNDALAEILESHPCLIPDFLPSVSVRNQGVMSINRWLSESPDFRGLKIPWVDFAERDELKEKIRRHFLAHDESPVLHIAGISGIGKTRTALEACIENSDTANTLYAPSLNELSKDFLYYIETQDVCIRLIVDEVSLAEFECLLHRFALIAHRVRLVTIGPARRDERRRPGDPMLMVLDEPDTTGGVLPVVKIAAPFLASQVQENIAEISGHDLRLALLLTFSTPEDPNLRDVPVRNLDEVWTRITRLFAGRLDASTFPNRYQLLTSAIDIGQAGQFRSELEYIADHFEVSVDDLDCVIRDAHQCGLGLKTPSFFEAGPRTLAMWVFLDLLWPRLSPTLDQFLQQMPSDRLRRRFLERCQEVPPGQRDEILDRIGVFFLTHLGQPEIARLSDREQSRVFQAWAETDPQRGLQWLKQAVGTADDDNLRRLRGDPDGSGGWTGRRQVVWLCENLACFAEYFWDCEEILFRLAQVETEQSIANNSTNTWKEMYLPVLSNTEVSFPERLDHLIHRLQDASDETLDLIVSAGMGILDTSFSRMAPPRIVGGRIVPEGWKPSTMQQLRDLQRDAGRRILSTALSLGNQLTERVAQHVISHLHRFVRIGLLIEAKEFIDAMNPSSMHMLSLRATLEETIYREELISKDKEEKPEYITTLRSWSTSIRPESVIDHVVDVTWRYPWTVHKDSIKEGDPDDYAGIYSDVARLLIEEPGVLDSLLSWFDSPKCVSAEYLARHAGKQDKQMELMPTVRLWLEQGRCCDFVVGYLSGLVAQQGHLPTDVLETVDAIASVHRSLALKATIYADISKSGFERIMRIMPNAASEEILLLRSLARGRWAKRLSPNDKLVLLDRLLDLSKQPESPALGVAFTLVVCWTDIGAKELDHLLLPSALQLLNTATIPQHAVEAHDWKIVAEMIMMSFPQETADALAAALIDFERYDRKRYAEEVIKELATSFPHEVMLALGSRMLDETTASLFSIDVYRGLFEAVGVDEVRQWVEEHGEQAARRVARHLAGPHIDENGNPVIPEVTDWLLTKYGNNRKVFTEFCMGQHSGEVRVGHARDRRESLHSLVDPFVDHKKQWVRDWARHELESFREEVQWDDEIEDQRFRT